VRYNKRIDENFANGFVNNSFALPKKVRAKFERQFQVLSKALNRPQVKLDWRTRCRQRSADPAI